MTVDHHMSHECKWPGHKQPSKGKGCFDFVVTGVVIGGIVSVIAMFIVLLWMFV